MFIVYKMEHVNYIGSTNDLKDRQRNHIINCYNKNSKSYNFKVYKNIRKKNSQIILIELFKYNGDCSRRIQRLVEQYYIEKYDSIKNGLNEINAFKNNKIYKKEWYEKNKDKRKEYLKKWCEENKEKIKKNKKEYYEKNKDKIKKYKKEYLKIKINCPICNSSVSRANLPRHQRTKKCKKFN